MNLIGAAHLLLIKNNKILLQRRFNTGYEDGNYGVPSGHLDGDETVRQAAAREAREETGITIHPHDLTVVHVMHRHQHDNTGERIDFFLRTTNWTGEPQNMEPDKCSELAWYPINNLPVNVIPYVQAALACVHQGVHYSEFDWGSE